MQQAQQLASQLLLFRIEEEYFCCPSQQVLTLIAPPTLTRVPFMPDFGRGAFDYQGQTASVISVRQKLHYSDTVDPADGVILLSLIEGKVAGFWIDAVDEVIEANTATWLMMPEGFRDDVLQRAISYEDKTAFYIDLHAFWKYQQQTFIDIHALDTRQLETMAEIAPAEPESMEARSLPVEDEIRAPEPEVMVEQEQPVVAIEPEPEPEIVNEDTVITSAIDEPESAMDDEAVDEYRIAASQAIQTEQYIEPEAETITPIAAEIRSIDSAKEDQGKQRKRYQWLLLLIPLLLALPFASQFFKRSDSPTGMTELETTTEAATSTPLAEETETKVRIELPEHTITVQKQPLENPPANVFQHIIREGDTLWDISSQYLDNPWLYPQLAQNNKIRDPDLIYPGDVVIIYRRDVSTDKR